MNNPELGEPTEAAKRQEITSQINDFLDLCPLLDNEEWAEGVAQLLQDHLPAVLAEATVRDASQGIATSERNHF